ncbi:MAG: hypothetical protein AB1726_06805, partial [Planctomycetota bacterium]
AGPSAARPAEVPAAPVLPPESAAAAPGGESTGAARAEAGTAGGRWWGDEYDEIVARWVEYCRGGRGG